MSFAARSWTRWAPARRQLTTTVKGQATLAGLSLADAQQNEFVIVAALADLHEVETTAVAVAFSAMTRRRLSGGVVVSYTIAYDDAAPALALDAAMFDQALTDAAARRAWPTSSTPSRPWRSVVPKLRSRRRRRARRPVVGDAAAFRPLGRGVLLVAGGRLSPLAVPHVLL